jgi:hypothetical protein
VYATRGKLCSYGSVVKLLRISWRMHSRALLFWLRDVSDWSLSRVGFGASSQRDIGGSNRYRHATKSAAKRFDSHRLFDRIVMEK